MKIRCKYHLSRARSCLIISIILLLVFIFSRSRVKESLFYPLSLFYRKLDLTAFETSLQCRPRQNIVFTKTHKCASSTVQNVLLRFGDSRNLTFVLPIVKKTVYLLPYMRKLFLNMTMPLPSAFSDHFNILCHHTRWHRELKAVMPEDTVYITIIREPASMFESAYNFLLLRMRYDATLETFIEKPITYFMSNTFKDKLFARNPMMYDLGLDREDFDDESKIDDKIKELYENFSLVMLSDYMDESLVLLRQLMCWTWSDVVVFHVNTRSDQFKQKISSATADKIRRWNTADVKLYEFFRKRFFESIEQYGQERMRTDVDRLRKLTNEWYGACVLRESLKDDPISINSTDKRFTALQKSVNGFHLTEHGKENATCIRLAMIEMAYTQQLRAKLWPNDVTLRRFNTSKN